MACPIRGSKSKPKVHLGSSTTPSSVVNSCTLIVPIGLVPSVCLGPVAGVTDYTNGRDRIRRGGVDSSGVPMTRGPMRRWASRSREAVRGPLRRATEYPTHPAIGDLGLVGTLSL